MSFGPKPGRVDLLDKAKRGDRGSREKLLEVYLPFVLKVASRFCGRFLTLGTDEEAGVALEAFNEAVDGYDPTTGVQFDVFAQTVIKRRLIDNLRRQARGRREIPMSGFDEEDGEGGVRNVVEAGVASAAYDRTQEILERREEITRYKTMLGEFGITLADLVRTCPRHEDARRSAIEVARLVAGDPELSAHLLNRKELPMKELEHRVNVSRKTLERQRRYIIAIALVYIGEFESLKSYLG